MNKLKLLRQTSEVFKTFGNDIIKYIEKIGIDDDIEEEIIAFKQRVKEIQAISNKLDISLQNKYGKNAKYTKDIVTVEVDEKLIKQAIDRCIGNENITSRVEIRSNCIVIVLVYVSDNKLTLKELKQEYIQAKMYVQSLDLELLNLSNVKWLTTLDNRKWNTKICKIKMHKDNKSLYLWLKDKLLLSLKDEYANTQIELLFKEWI